MTIFALASNNPLLIVEVAAAFFVGAGIGAAHFVLLRRNVDLFVTGGSILYALALHMARFLATGGALYLVARFGALPLAAALLGIVSARIIVVRRLGGAQ